MASTINAKTTGVGGIDASGDASGVLALQTGGTTAVTIDASQNVGIGTASPVSYGKLSINQPALVNTSTIREVFIDAQVNGATDTSGALSGITFRFNPTTYSSFSQLNRASGVYGINTDTAAGGLYGRSAGLVFYTSSTDATATEKMRIDSSGNVGIGTSSLTEKFEATGSINSSGQSNNFYTGTSRVAMDYTAGSTAARIGHFSGASGVTTGVVGLYTNGSEKMRINSAGLVTMPYNPAFYAYGPASNGSLPSGAYTQVTGLNGINYNVGSNYNPANSTFTAPVAGLYAFKLRLCIVTGSATAITGGADFQLQLYVNGSAPISNYGGALLGYYAINETNIVVVLAAGDTATMNVQQTTGAALTIQAAMTKFSGYLVR